MKTEVETKNDGKEFKRFDDLLRKVIAVPKEEINKRERVEKEHKAVKKTTLRRK